MTRITAISLALILSSLPAFGDENSRVHWDGRVQGQEVLVEDLENGSYINNLRTAFRLNGSVDLSEDGCTKLQGRITTGSRYNNEWDMTGIGDADQDFNLNLRHISISTNCLKEDVTYEAGSFAPINHGRLGLSPYGWINGVRVIIQEKDSNREWIATVGSIDQLDSPNAFKRSINDVNNYGLQVNQKLEGGHNIFIQVDKYEDTLFARSSVRIAVNRYLGFIDSVAAEVSTADGKEVGNLMEVAMSYGRWDWRVFRAELEPLDVDGEAADKTLQLTKNYYGLGENYFGEVSRTFGRDEKFEGLFRLRDGDAGRMAQIQITRRFGK